MSDAVTPSMNAMPPRKPLLRLCLMIEKTTGPTDILSNKPSVNPFKTASNISAKIIICVQAYK